MLEITAATKYVPPAADKRAGCGVSGLDRAGMGRAVVQDQWHEPTENRHVEAIEQRAQLGSVVGQPAQGTELCR